MFQKISSPLRQTLVILGCAVCLFAVFFAGLAKWLWGRQHYQFFPIVLVAAFSLAWIRLRDMNVGHTPRLTARIAIYTLFSLVLFGCATLLHSHLLGAISGLLTIWSLVWFFGGSHVINAIRGPMFLLLIVFPLPLNLDLKLIIGLQKLASAAASSFLDMRGIRHLLSGVAISTENKDFLVEEACSGIHSLFSCICVVAFVCVAQRYSFLRTAINIAQSIGWVIAANAIRVFLVIFAASNWGLDLGTGWRHEILGVCTYLAALLLAMSTDRLLQFIVPIARKATGKTEIAYEEADNAFVQLTKSIEGFSINLNEKLNKPRFSQTQSLRITWLALGLLFLPLSAIAYGRTLSERIGGPTNSEALTEVNSAHLDFDEQSLPKSIDGWILTGQEKISRNTGDPLGTSSTVFTYSGHGLTANFSIDGFYPAWHDLAYCYTALDWKLQSQLNSLNAETEIHQTEISLSIDHGQHAVSYFSCFDSHLKSVKPGEQTIGVLQTFELLLSRLPGLSNPNSGDNNYVPPVFQLQLMCGNSQELLDHEKTALGELFQELSIAALGELKETAQ